MLGQLIYNMLGQRLYNMLGQRLYNMLGQRLYNMLGQHFWMSKVPMVLHRQPTLVQWKLQLKNLPGCLFIRTFLLKSSYTLIRMLKCLKLNAPPLTRLICDIRLRVSVTCTFTIKHGTHVRVVTCSTYLTRIDYNALLTPPIAKACVVQWIECRTPDSEADGSNHGVGRYFLL